MIELEIKEDASGVYFHASVKPKARKNAVLGTSAGRLKIAVTAVPEKGKANAAVVALLADFFGIAKGRVTIKSGETSHIKLLMLEGVTADQVVGKLSEKGVG
jgi:hypothetical protein